AKTGANVKRLFTMIDKIRQHATRQIGTGELNRFLHDLIERQPPPSRSKRRFKLFYATQVKAENPHPFQVPVFLLFGNDPQLLPESYINFLRARLRERWEYPGLPLVFSLRGREKRVKRI
ncbi:MAG TPA: hypothetical protein VIT23_03090, partial [Terrimicrobiaceae bacterium]